MGPEKRGAVSVLGVRVGTRRGSCAWSIQRNTYAGSLVYSRRRSWEGGGAFEVSEIYLWSEIYLRYISTDISQIYLIYFFLSTFASLSSSCRNFSKKIIMLELLSQFFIYFEPSQRNLSLKWKTPAKARLQNTCFESRFPLKNIHFSLQKRRRRRDKKNSLFISGKF